MSLLESWIRWKLSVKVKCKGMYLSCRLAKGKRLETGDCYLSWWGNPKMKIIPKEWNLIPKRHGTTRVIFMKHHWDMGTQAELFTSLTTKHMIGGERWEFFPFFHSMFLSQHYEASVHHPSVLSRVVGSEQQQNPWCRAAAQHSQWIQQYLGSV